jgi:thymidylate synthase (FAD)
MRIVKPSYQIIYPDAYGDPKRTIDKYGYFTDQCRIIERAARTCYKSEDLITEESYKALIKHLIDRGHEAMLEFGDMVVHFVTDRGVSHEIVCHRLCSFAQESTRYCNYSKDKFGKEVTFIEREFNNEQDEAAWHESIRTAETCYLQMLQYGATAQEARSVLPNSLKTEIVVKANFREWRHIFRLHAISKAAHPDMRRLIIPLYEHCREICPIIFDMGDVE